MLNNIPKAFEFISYSVSFMGLPNNFRLISDRKLTNFDTNYPKVKQDTLNSLMKVSEMIGTLYFSKEKLRNI